jgi:hypothetical protein
MKGNVSKFLSIKSRTYIRCYLRFCMWLSCVFLLGRVCAILLFGHLGFIVLECVRGYLMYLPNGTYVWENAIQYLYVCAINSLKK